MVKRSLYGIAAILVFACLQAGAVDFTGRALECPANSTFFASGFQRFASLKNNRGSVDARYNPTAGAVGYVYNQGAWHAGAALNYEYGTRKLSARDTGASLRVRSSTPGISLFGGMRSYDGWYVDGAAFLGFASNKARRFELAGNPFANSGSNRDHDTLFAIGAETGRVFTLGDGLSIKPHIGFDFAHTPGESYSFRSGAARAGYRGDAQNYYEIPLGVTFSKAFSMGGWTVAPKLDLTMVNSFGRMDAMNSATGFAYRTANGWKVAGLGGGHFGGRATAGVDAKLGERATMGLEYTYEARKRYNDHRLSATVGLAF